MRVRNSLNLLGGVSGLALLGACSGLPDMGSAPGQFTPWPSYYAGQPASTPPQTYAYDSRQPVPQRSRWSWNGYSWVRDGAIAGLGVGAGMLANQALSGGERQAAVGGAETALERVGERAALGGAERSVATRAAESMVARGVGAAALTGLEEAETAEVLEFVFTRLIWFAL
jgi:hypothetical protein